MTSPPSLSEDVRTLRIAIIGAGMAGLSTALSLAHRGFRCIAVYEAAADLGFVGAGIQLAPNMARILDRLGVWDGIAAEATRVQAASIRQGSSNEELGFVDLSHVEEKYGYPHMVGHRASLAGGLYAGCQREKDAITFHFGTAVKEILAFGPQPRFLAQPRSGEAYEVSCDVLLAADGIKSVVREAMLKTTDSTAKIQDSGQAAYRIMLSRAQMSSSPELLELLDADRVTRWIGERRHIIAYPVAAKQIYNISSAHPDTHFADAPSASYTTKGSKAEMKEVFAAFCPLVHQMLDLVPDGEVCEWRLRVHERLSSWTSSATALAGDACHPTLPHMNQGAAQAIEDAAVLSVVLSRLPDSSPQSIMKALTVYEQLRMERAYVLVELAAANGTAMQLGEGAAQAERDKLFAKLKEGGGKGGPSPDKSADEEAQRMIYGEDVVVTAEREFGRLFATEA